MQRVIAQILRAPSGGIRKHVLDIVENLSNSEMKQILITNTNEADVDLSYLKENRNVEVHHVAISESPGFFDFVNIIKIYFILKNKKVNVLHGHGAKGGLYARVLSIFFSATCLYTPHGGSLHRVHGHLKNRLYDFLEKIMMPFTDLFIFESHYSANSFAENIRDPGLKKVVNYNGVDIPTVFSDRHYEAGKTIHFASFGLLRELKGHDIFIKTCRLLKENGIPFSYTIYGEGDFSHTLTKLIKDFDLQSEVKILKYSNNVQVEMLKYDFIVQPSRFESFGYVPVEAMSLKIPVIVSHVGGLKEVVDESSGYVSFDNTPSSYLKIIEEIFKGDSKLAEKTNNAFEKVQKHFSKKVMLSLLEDKYR